MNAAFKTPEEYISSLEEERKEPVIKLRKVIAENLPPGFSEEVNYGMIGFVVPHSIYPGGYHCNPEQPLPFLNIASQKNFTALYHMGLYADKDLHSWFISEYAKHSTSKPDMGKSCIRFKNVQVIPFALIGELCSKMSPADWIRLYESTFRHK